MSTEPSTTSHYEDQTRPTYPSVPEVRKQESIDVHKDLESLANDTLEV